MPKADNEKKPRRWSLVARIVVAAVAIGWVLQGQDWRELAKVFQRLSVGYFALSLATYAVAQLVIAVRWWLLLRAQSIYIGIFATFRLHFTGLFYNNLMPSSIGGDLLKAYYVTRHTDKRLEGALSVFVDRVVGLAGMVLMAIVAYVVFLRGRTLGAAQGDPAGPGLSLASYRGAILLTAAILAVSGVFLLVLPATRRTIWRLWGRIAARGTELVGRSWTAVVVYCSKPATLLVALLLTFLGQSVVITAFWLLGRNLGVAAEAKYYFVIFPVAWVMGAVPISIAGAGILEGGMVTLFVSLTATTAESALALALCQRFVWVLASLPGGAIHLLGAHLPEEFLVDGEKCAN